MTATRFEVRYGTSLKVTTGIMVVLVLGVVAFDVFVDINLFHARNGADPRFWLFACTTLAVPLVLLALTTIFVVLRYEIDDTGLHVVRLIGRLRIFSRISSAAVADGALKRSLRMFGNGGVFSFNGWYWVRGYGWSRLWVTDLRNLVALRGDRGCAFVSPADRDAFIATVRARFGVAP